MRRSRRSDQDLIDSERQVRIKVSMAWSYIICQVRNLHVLGKIEEIHRIANFYIVFNLYKWNLYIMMKNEE